MPENYVCSTESIVIPSGAAVPAAGNAIDLRTSLVGSVEIAANGWTSATLAFKVADNKADTFVPAYDESGALITISSISTSLAASYNLPAALFAYRYCVPWSETGGSDTNQGGDRTLKFHLKG